MKIGEKIHSPVSHVVLYAVLLVFTPFIMLQNYLQHSVKRLSEFSFGIAGLELPLMFSIAFVLFLGFIFAVRKRITLYRIIAFAICIAMIALSQRISDFYMQNPFYDLQNNWHYIAYAIFAVLMYRMLKARGKDSAYIATRTYFTALSLSTFDEGFQYFLSSRVFDIGDIAKDGWGVLIGLVIVLYVYEQGESAKKTGWQITQNNFRSYFQSTFAFLTVAGIFNLFFLIYGALLSELEYLPTAMLFLFGSFIVIFTLIHLSRFKPVKIAIISLLVLIFISIGASFIIHREDHIVYNSFGLTVYKGIPIPYFDIMIFPNGTFRPVDKKHYFYPGDKTTMYEFKPDIVIIGTGAYGRGGLGFGSELSTFGYNKNIGRCTQFIMLPTPRACEVFNRLKKEGRNVLFVIHNTC